MFSKIIICNVDELGYEVPFSMLEYIPNEKSPYVLKIAMEPAYFLIHSYDHEAIFGEFKVTKLLKLTQSS